MRFVVAIDSFKGSLSSKMAGEAAREGILAAIPSAEVDVCAVADGGEGTFDALFSELCDEKAELFVRGPLYDNVSASYGLNRKGSFALIEMSAAAGLTLVPIERRDPLYTTTLGVGDMIRDALEKGARDFIIGIGGSATNDCGIGMLTALGFAFLDKDGKAVTPSAIGIKDIASIDMSRVHPALAESRFTVLCDVENPLCGERGCSYVYGAQKGADKESIAAMDGWISSFAALVDSTVGGADATFPGSGAAGGLGYALKVFLNAELKRGIDAVIEKTGLCEKIKNADIVFTGEGRIDSQSAMGKTPVGIARVAKKYGKRVIALAGSVGSGATACHGEGIDAIFSIQRGAIELSEAMRSSVAFKNMRDTAEEIARLVASFERGR